MNNNERILSHKMSKKLDLDEIKSVPSGGSMSHYFTGDGTGTPSGGRDGCYDWTIDL